MAPRLWLAVLVSTALAIPARAETLGVLVEGPTGEGGPLRVRIEGWALEHQLKLVGAPLSLDAAKTLANCLVIDDRKCAAAVVDRRGKADNVVYARMEEGTISVFWFRKRHAAVAQKLACAPCGDDLLASVLDKLSEKSEAATPEETTEEPDDSGKPAEHVEAPPPENPAPRWPLYAIGGGAALAVTGVALYVTSESPTGASPTYLNDRPIGTAFMIGGVAVAAVGAYFWFTHGSSAPTAAPTSGGAVVGWALLF
jgi:hypothetical protein